MNVLQLSSEKTWRGGEQQIAYLLEELDKMHVKNFVACKKDSAFESYCVKHSIPYIPLKFSGSFDLITALKIKNYCIKNNIDIVHMHSGNSHSVGVLSSLLGNPSKLILSRRVDFPVKNNWLSKYKYNFKKIEKIICVSEAIKAMIQPSIKKYSKITVIHSGYDPGRFKSTKNQSKLHSEFGLKKEEKIIANVSALAPHKDYFTFVDTVKRFLEYGRNAKFFIIGDGVLKSQIETYITKNELNEHIILTGFRNDIDEILPELDIFLITSKTEGLGTSVLDAMANRIPVVATAAGGIPEMVIDGNTGLLYEVGDYNGLAKGLTRILKDNELKFKLVDNAFALVSSEFTKVKTAAKTYQIYEEVHS